MSTLLEQRVAELPEVYQTIYGHSEWDDQVSRDCNERLSLIVDQYDALSKTLGRPLRVLDLGCAQGFFSLSLAAKGASVTGIDFQAENIALCELLASENPDFDAHFSVGQIENVINGLEDGEYDLAIGLSVFHHIIHLHGLAETRKWIQRLADATCAVILELALKEEPLYWAASLPENPRELIEECAFSRLIKRFPTHLSDIARPLYVVSNHYLLLSNFTGEFQHWSSQPYFGAGNAHNGSRRYYWGEHFFCKLFGEFKGHMHAPEEEKRRNHQELKQEEKILLNSPDSLKVPSLIVSGADDELEWLIVDPIEGTLLSDLITQGKAIDREQVLKDVLAQLVALEQSDLYHDDVRPWNIMISPEGSAQLIDLGSVSGRKQDCDWPLDLVQSFMVFVNELYGIKTRFKGFRRSAPISPFSLPEPIANWLYAMWIRPVEQWQFTELERLYNERDTLPSFRESLTGTDLWIDAEEILLLETQSLARGLDHNYHRLEKKSTWLEGRQDTIESQLSLVLDELTRLRAGNEGSARDQALMSASNNIASVRESGSESGGQPWLDSSDEVDRLRGEISHLIGENQSLKEELAGVYNSRSWRITRGCRYIGTQLRKLKQDGLIRRCKAFIKKVLRWMIAFLKRHPQLKEKLKRTLHKLGLYNFAASLYWRLVSRPQDDEAIEQENRIQNQIERPELIPSEVNRVFNMLKKKD